MYNVPIKHVDLHITVASHNNVEQTGLRLKSVISSSYRRR